MPAASLSLTWLCGAAAGAVETLCTQPFEVTKTLQQVGGKRGGGVLETATHVARVSGLRGFYYGTPITLVQSAGKVGIRFTAFEACKRRLGAQEVFLSGAIAGACEAAVWIAPCERLKVLRVTQVGAATPHHVSWWHGLARVLRDGGARSLWRGCAATVVRNSGSVGFRFLGYSYVLDVLREWDHGAGAFGAACAAEVGGLAGGSGGRGWERPWWHALVAGGAVGAASTVLNNPVDVVKSHMQASGAGATRGGGLAASVRSLHAEGGWRAFSRGLGARLCKITVGQAVIFYTYERVLEAATSARDR